MSEKGGRSNLNFKQKVRESDRSSGSTDTGPEPELMEEADEVFESRMSEIHREAEEKLKERFMDKEAEEEVPGFDKAYNRLRNLDNYWSPARRGKSHEEIKEKELERLQNLMEGVEKAIRLELKAACYLSIVVSELSDLEITPEEVARYNEEEEDQEESSVGSYIQQANEKAEKLEDEGSSAERNQVIASEVNQKLEKEEEKLKQEIREEKEVITRYEKFFELLKGLEKELEAIEEAKEEEVEQVDKVKTQVRICKGHSRVTVAERKHIVERMENAEGVKQTISRVFYSGLLR